MNLYSHPVIRKTYKSQLDFIKGRCLFIKARSLLHAKQLFMILGKRFCETKEDTPMYINEATITREVL
jgi:hypothetical protein